MKWGSEVFPSEPLPQDLWFAHNYSSINKKLLFEFTDGHLARDVWDKSAFEHIFQGNLLGHRRFHHS